MYLKKICFLIIIYELHNVINASTIYTEMDTSILVMGKIHVDK